MYQEPVINATYFLCALSLKTSCRNPEKRQTHYLFSAVTCDVLHIFYSSQKAVKVMRLSNKVRPSLGVCRNRCDYIVYFDSWHKFAKSVLTISTFHSICSFSAVLIGHVRYINILAWLRGFRVKIANFSSFFCLSIPKRDLDTKKTTPNIEV